MTSVGRIATMAVFTTWRAYNTPGAIAWKILIPVALGAVIAFFAGGQSTPAPTVAMVDEDGTLEASALIQAMAAASFDVSVVTREQAEDGITAGTLKSALVIPEGFADSLSAGPTSLEVLHGEGFAPGEAEARAALVVRALELGIPAVGPAVVRELPRGSGSPSEYGKLRGVFGVYLILSLSALISSACTLHEERAGGRLQRTLAAGVPFGEVIGALVVSVALVGVIQAVGVLGITGWWGTPWLAPGWSAILLTTLGVVVAFSGIGVGIAGFIPGPNQAKIIFRPPAPLGVRGWSVLARGAPTRRAATPCAHQPDVLGAQGIEGRVCV